MSQSHLQSALHRAHERCQEDGTRLTSKRSQLLEILLASNEPLSAYDILDRFNLRADKPMQPTSAYRMLDFLCNQQLIHKLASENKYVACSHITCCAKHPLPQFLICQVCRMVKEIAIAPNIIETLRKQVTNAGYRLTDSPLELDCICDGCANKA